MLKYIKYLQYLEKIENVLEVIDQIKTSIKAAKAGEKVPLDIKGIRVKIGGKRYSYALKGELQPE